MKRTIKRNRNLVQYMKKEYITENLSSISQMYMY